MTDPSAEDLARAPARGRRRFWKLDPGFAGWSLPRLVWGGILGAWALLVLWLLLAPPGWAPPESWGILHYLLRPAGHAVPLLRPWIALLAGGPWSWGVGADVWIGLAIGAAGLGVMTLAGRLLCACFETHMPRAAEFALWFAVGVGLCGVLNTLLALAGLLYQWLALGALCVLLLALWIAARRAARRAGATLASADLPPGPAGRRGLRTRRAVAVRWERRSVLQPTGRVERLLAGAMVFAIGLLTALTFYHAVFYPETYWDSLILYLGYARDVYLQHAFPVKVVGQVGVGLGANYPHLYEITGAGIATWAGRWSTLPQQLAAPLAGLLTILLVHHTVLRLSRSVLVALTVTLLVRAMPYGLTYNIYASNYSFAMLYAAAFLYAALRYMEDGLPGYFRLATLCAAFAAHVNYLMAALWICWAVMIAAAHVPRRLPFGHRPGKYLGIVRLIHPNDLPDWAHVREWPTLGRFLRGRLFWSAGLAGGALAAIWYVRNWIVTGNPVYAFFTGLFPGTKHVNPEVMASASQEWMLHGDGIGIYGESVLARLANSWFFFLNNFSTSYKWAPGFAALVVPGVLVCLFFVLRQFFFRRRVTTTEESDGETPEEPVRAPDDATRFGVVALTLFAVLFGYHYFLGAYYLYHLLPAFAVFGVFMFFALRHCPWFVLWGFAVYALAAAAVPGIPLALVGPKFTGSAVVAGRRYDAMRLDALRRPGVDPDFFYRLRYGREPLMWDFINARARALAATAPEDGPVPELGVLTHENRRLLFEPNVRLVHMDDWEVQQIWDASKTEKLKRLRELGVRYYLEIPYEFDHPVNARLGHRAWVEDGTLQEVFRAGDAVLYATPRQSD